MFEKLVASQLKASLTKGFKDFYEKVIKKVDLDGNGKEDCTEVLEASFRVIDKSEKAFHSANVPGIIAGANQIVGGFKLIMNSVDVPALQESVADAWDDITKIAKLVGLAAEKYLPRRPAAGTAIATLPSSPGGIVDVEIS